MLIDKWCSFSFRPITESNFRSFHHYSAVRIHNLRISHSLSESKEIEKFSRKMIMVGLCDQPDGVRFQAEAEVTLFLIVSRQTLGPNQFPI